MTEVYIGIGSNIDPTQNIQFALNEISSHFGEFQVSRVFESTPVGFEGDNFLNLAVRFSTEMPIAGLVEVFREIEDRSGRDRGSKNGHEKEYAPRTLDIDILLYDDYIGTIEGIELPRPEITAYAYVLLPLTEIAGSRKHPGSEKTYDELWQAFEADNQEMWPVELGVGSESSTVRYGQK